MSLLKRGIAFQFAPPIGWHESRDGDRFVFHGPDDQELIVSGTVITGRGAGASYDGLRENLVANALAAMNKAVAHPDLEVVSGVTESVTSQSLRCWRLDAEAPDDGVMFLQAALEAEGGVLLVTFEAPRDAHSRDVFVAFINGVRSATSVSNHV